jgi:hypothetical protein
VVPTGKLGPRVHLGAHGVVAALLPRNDAVYIVEQTLVDRRRRFDQHIVFVLKQTQMLYVRAKITLLILSFNLILTKKSLASDSSYPQPTKLKNETKEKYLMPFILSWWLHNFK